MPAGAIQGSGKLASGADRGGIVKHPVPPCLFGLVSSSARFVGVTAYGRRASAGTGRVRRRSAAGQAAP